MELVKTWLPDLNKPGMKADDKIRALNEYLITLEKQLRHVLSNIDEENFSETLLSNLNGTADKLKLLEETIANVSNGSNTGETSSGSYDGELPIASKTQAGIMQVGSNLKVTAAGVVSVDTATEAEEDNTKPITSAAVHTVVGNVEVLLSTI